MAIIVFTMILGVAVGYALRRRRMPWLPHAVTAMVWLLLFLLGIEVGSNGGIIGHLHSLGVESLAIAVCATAGSVACSVWLWRKLPVGCDGDASKGGDA